MYVTGIFTTGINRNNCVLGPLKAIFWIFHCMSSECFKKNNVFLKIVVANLSPHC